MTKQADFHIAGTILDVNISDIMDAFRDLPYKIRESGSDEVRISDDNFDLDIYACSPGKSLGQDFLISGGMDGTADAVNATIKIIADKLLEKNVMYSFEICSWEKPDQEINIRHPDLKGYQ